MNAEQIREYCLSKKAVTEEFPFDEVTLVFKVMDRIFALVSLDEELSVNLKCKPDRALDLRERFPAVSPGYHMNKKHWNTIVIDGTMKWGLVKELIDHSYEIVVQGLSRRSREELRMQQGKNFDNDLV